MGVLLVTYQAARKIHLWVGLILAIVLIIEAITGLVLAEPWIVGQGKPQIPIGDSQNMEQRKSMPRSVESGKPVQSGFNAFGFAKGLHQGKVGGFDLTWVVDLSAIGLIVLALTGVYLSIPFFRTRSKKSNP